MGFPKVTLVEPVRVLFDGREVDFCCESPWRHIVEPFEFPRPGFDGVCHVRGEFIVGGPIGCPLTGEIFAVVGRHEDGTCRRWPALMKAVKITALGNMRFRIFCEFTSSGAPTEEVDADLPVVVEGV